MTFDAQAGEIGQRPGRQRVVELIVLVFLAGTGAEEEVAASVDVLFEVCGEILVGEIQRRRDRGGVLVERLGRRDDVDLDAASAQRIVVGSEVAPVVPVGRVGLVAGRPEALVVV